MGKILKFFIPHEENNYHPHALRHEVLTSYLAIFLSSQLILNLAFSTRPQVLGFATSIYKNELINLTNSQRQASGLKSLAENEELDMGAKLKAEDMFQNNYWAHISPSGVTPWHWFDEAGYQYYMAGENLARDFNTSAGVVEAWMNSPSHRENILNPNFTEIGMAVANGKLLGEDTTLVVQFFGRPENIDQAILPATTNISPPARNPFQPVSPAQPVLLSTSQGVNDSLNLKLRLTNMFSPQSWGWGQKVAILMLSLLVVLFGIDSVVLYRKKLLHLRKNSHSFLHIITIAILVLGIMASSGGLLI